MYSSRTPRKLARMDKIPDVRRVVSLDMTQPQDRDDYEKLINMPGIRIVKEDNFAMGGTGAVIRVIDYKEQDLSADIGFNYEKPVN